MKYLLRFEGLFGTRYEYKFRTLTDVNLFLRNCSFKYGTVEVIKIK